MSFYSDVFWGLDWMVLSLVVVFYLFPFLLSSHLSKMGVLKYYFSSFWWWCAVEQILNIFCFVLFCLILPKVGNCVWQIESNTKSIKKLPIFCSKGKVVFDQSNQSKIVLWRLYHVVFDISASKHKISKAFFMQRHLVHFLIYNRLSFQKRDVWNGPREINGFCQQIHFLLYFL